MRRSLLCLLALWGCDTSNPAQAPVDAAPPDAAVDSTAPDAAPVDAAVDAAPPVVDAAPPMDAAPETDAGVTPDAALDPDATVSPDAALDPDVGPPPMGSLALNEVSCHGDDWIEVIALDRPVDLGAWRVSDDRREPGQQLPQLTLQPGELLLLDALSFNVGCDERIYLRDPSDAIVDEIAVGDPRRATAWGRLPDGQGAWALTDPTPGAPNRPAPAIEVVINEIACNGGDFVELHNRGAGPADLKGWRVSDDPVDQGRALELDALLDPGGYLLLQRQSEEAPDGFEFGIGCEDTIHLIDPTGAVVDQYALTVQPRAYSLGRVPDGAGAFERTLPTPGAPNRVEDPEESLFQPDRVFEIRLTLAPEQLAQLNAAPREYVDGTVQVEDDPPIAAQIRLKGRAGSFRTLDRKSAFKVRVNHIEGQRVRGQKKLTLNNSVQDRSLLHEWLTYTIFRGMGVASPRTGSAYVYLNDELYGLYHNIESLDDLMLDRWFPTTESMYEGAYGTDLFNDHLNRFEQDEGDPDDRSNLARLIERINTVPAADFYDQSQDIVDWAQVLTTMVVEIYIGHWDGYAPTRNNYYFHFDAAGVARLLPWGSDQTFDRHLGWRDGRGRLLETCRASENCMAAFDATLVRLVAFLDQLDPVPMVRAHADRMIPWYFEHPRRLYTPAQVADAVQRTIAFLERRRNDVRAEVDCLLAEDPDPDGDGFTCANDCRPDDPNSFPGAEEICGDGIDQDCNGQIDDGIGCPDCVELFRGGRRYLTCTTPRSYANARAHCQEHGADLAIVDDADEAAWLIAEAIRIRNQDYWIGLDDLAQEGTFVWVDGSPLTLDNWSAGEPNNAGNEDCAHFWARNGQWNDLPCDRPLGVLCEDVCPPVDADGDGFNGCGIDCDDNDPNTFPGAEDLCNDGIDQDCDGQVDESDACIDCRPIVRGPHRYLACVTPRNWEEARVECQALGYDLAVLNTPSEVLDLAAAGRALGASFWVGLSDLDAEGTFRWVDGVEVDPAAPWLPGEPNDFRMTEDCAELVTARDGFNDFNCAARSGFICEAPCGAGQDGDRDGVPRCAGDCDDGDPMVGLCVPPAP